MVHKILEDCKILWTIIDVLRLGYDDETQMRVVILITASSTETEPGRAQEAVDRIRLNVDKILGCHNVDMAMRDGIFCRLDFHAD